MAQVKSDEGLADPKDQLHKECDALLFFNGSPFFKRNPLDLVSFLVKIQTTGPKKSLPSEKTETKMLGKYRIENYCGARPSR